MKILHTADIHLRDKDIEEAERCLAFLLETARSESVDLAVIAGDIFDSQEVRLDSKAAKLAVRSVSSLADICPVAIIIGTSSHDGKAAEVLGFVRGNYPVHVATNPEQIEMAGAILTLIPQATKQFFQTSSDIRQSDQEISAAMSALFAGFGAQAEGKGPHILVYHGGISGAKVPNGYVPIGMEIEVSTDQMMLANPDLGCLGHIHQAQQLGDRFFYAGPIYATKIDETGPNGFWIHEIGSIFSVIHNFVHTPDKLRTRLEYDFTSNGPVENFLEVVKGLPLEDTLNAWVRLDFKVWQDQAAVLDREKIRSYLVDSGALDVDIRIIRVPRQTVRSAEVLNFDRLRDKLRAMASMKSEEVGEGILSKADFLEDRQAEELLGEVAK